MGGWSATSTADVTAPTIAGASSFNSHTAIATIMARESVTSSVADIMMAAMKAVRASASAWGRVASESAWARAGNFSKLPGKAAEFSRGLSFCTEATAEMHHCADGGRGAALLFRSKRRQLG